MINKSTKIGATIGPACEEVATLVSMIKAGMNFARLNFSHGDHKSHAKLIKNIRSAEEKTGVPIAIMGDIRGPRIRLGGMVTECVKIKHGEVLTFVVGDKSKNSQEVLIDCPKEILKFLKKGHKILIDDGNVEVEVLKISLSSFTAVVVEGEKLCPHKGLNFPDSHLDIPPISAKDKKDLEFCVKQGVDAVAMSFVTKAQDILNLKSLIKGFETKHHKKEKQEIFIVAKIERYEAVSNIDEIIKVADGIMIARGDLGLELEQAVVPITQKSIIEKCNQSAKPVIVATQMLDSMQEKKRPTRAEVSDVANAVVDHADALLLTNETAAGKYPVLTIKTMSEIIVATEKSTFDDMNLVPSHKKGGSIDLAISELSRLLAEEVGAKLILAASITGGTGRLISHVRPSMPILVATNSKRAWRQLILSWGVTSFILPPVKTIEELITKSINYIKTKKIAKKKDLMIIVTGEPVGHAGNVNLVEVRKIK